jgi:hypothetical protein
MSEHYSKAMGNGELVDHYKQLLHWKDDCLKRFLDLEHELDSFDDGYEDRHAELSGELDGIKSDIYDVRQELLARGLIKKKETR